MQRRTFLASGAVAAACAPLTTGAAAVPQAAKPDASVRYCLNMSTIKIGKHPIREQLKIAAEAGYDSVELWLRDVETFTKSGGKLSDLRKEIVDLGLTVDSAIAFGQWVVDDDAKRAAGLEQCKRDMGIVAELGGKHIAAPPSGATNLPKLDLSDAAERYAALCEVGKVEGVAAQLELWGFSDNLSTLAEVLFVAAASGHADACILLDVYHLYKGGNDFQNVGLVPAQKMPCLHMNDYPAQPPRASIKDEHRVFPGDGVAPIPQILTTLFKGGFSGTLSLELFNRSYWERPAADVAKEGLEKMRQAVAAAS